MTNNEKLECVREVIRQTLKDLPFTFEGLLIELTQNHEKSEMIIHFRFNEFGNNNKTLK